MKTPSLLRAVGALLVAAVLSSTLRAGTPLICHPYDIGPAKSLPGGARKGVDPAYDRSNLARDTLALLTPDTPIIVRMETLRRAAIYATGNLRKWRNASYTTDDRAVAFGLLDQLRARATRATEADADLALFDLAFFTETLRQTELDPALNGYDLLRKVAASRPDDADVQFALALASSWPARREHGDHLAQAMAGAKPDSLLAANLRSHFGR